MKYFTKNFLITCAILISANFFAQEVSISKQQLPPEINRYIATYFPETAISKINKETKLRYVEYEIRLDNGTKLEFNNTKIKEIESHQKLPNGVVPKNILDYVSKNYPQNFIKEWKFDDGKQKIELDNSLDLVFTKKGQFLRVDD